MKLIKHILRHKLLSLRFSVIRYYCISNESISLNEGNSSCEYLSNQESKFIYYFEDNLRKVYPFYYRYEAFCKGRWLEKNIVDIYKTELTLCSREEIARRIANGLIKINNKIVNIDYIFKAGDFISSVVHRHELAVLDCPINILFENEDLLVVNKPPSIPIHPAGLYFHNTMLSILSNEYKRNNLYILYRLDRLTSGVLLFAKSKEKSGEFHREINLGNIRKEYVCRVEGNFPDGTVMCNKPIKSIYRKIGACIIHPEGKLAMTEFKKLSYNGKSSVVLCRPFTGRMHQIRVHLQFLGYPIINDPIYNSNVFGVSKGKNGDLGKPASQLIKDLLREHASEWCIENTSVKKEIPSKNEENFLKFGIFKQYYCANEVLHSNKKDSSKFLKDKHCSYCNRSSKDPVQLSLGMFLHARRYEISRWKFESDMPFWAYDDWNVV